MMDPHGLDSYSIQKLVKQFISITKDFKSMLVYLVITSM